MSGDVLHLPGRGPAAPGAEMGPVADVIQTLENLLEDARKGEIRALGVALVRERGVIATGYAYHPQEKTGNLMIAAMTYLQHRFIQDQMS